jgi:hypothetical protein
MDIHEPTVWDRIVVAAVSLLLAAFVMSVAAPVIANASTSDNAKRDDDFRAITAVEDDEDDDRDQLRDKKSGKKSGKKKSGRKGDKKSGKKSGKGSGKSRVAMADRGGDSKGTRDKTGKSTRKDKSDKTGKNTGNGKDTRTGKSGDNTRTGQASGNGSANTGASRG